jgi:hypothetical protein
MEPSVKKLTEIFNQYKENNYVINRLEYYIQNLPTWINNDINNYEKRINRTNELTNEYEIFCKIFLSKYKYFYLPSNNCFYEYDDKTYKIIKEDNIHYQLLSTITIEGKLVQWKHKTKTHIIKLIKERTLFTSIPETYTIQSVLGFLQTTIFETKDSAKYFLTVLGDNILKKNNEFIYIVNQNTKKILGLVEDIGNLTLGSSIIQNFITKHHDSHKHSNYRLIKTTDVQISLDVIKDMLNKIGIDLLCVASHYSKRYNNAESYLLLKAKGDENTELTKHVLFFTNNSSQEIIDDFVSKCLNESSDESFIISWKNMHYIWKLYLSQLNIPNMIYSNNLKDNLKMKLVYNTDNDSFTKITSKYLPQISMFLHFWEKYIIIENGVFNEYEIDELLCLYKYINTPSISITEQEMIKIINHFFLPDINIIENKFVVNIKCSLWNKCDSIQFFLDYYKSNHLLNKKENVLVYQGLLAFDELYLSYQSFCNASMYVNNNLTMVVSKIYFENYISNELKQFIQFEKFISTEWLQL